MTLNNRPDIIKAVALLDSGEELVLVQRPLGNGDPSQCLFFEPFTIDTFTIQLRLDWSTKAMDSLDNPTLDADISQNGKKYDIDRRVWHHTPKTFNDEWIYEFKFQNIVQFRFKLRTTSQRHLTGRALIVAPEADSDQMAAAGSAEAELRFRRMMGLHD
jgi:hypothetical protein